MLNYLWGGMILIGVVWGLLNGKLNEVTLGALNGASEAVSLGLTMLGIMAVWNGILEIGQASGLIDWLAEKMEPVLHFLFPHLEPEHPAKKDIAVNMIANMLGLGSAATPAGLRAMKALKKPGQTEASREMCTFLIVNISSLQLIPVSVVAYRSSCGSADPAGIIGPALAATAVSTAVGVVFSRIMDR